MSSRKNIKYTILDDAAANGAGNSIQCTDFRHCVITVHASDTSDMNIKFQGSVADPGQDPDFESDSDRDNDWSFVQVKNYSDGNAIVGSSGIVLATEGHHAQYEADINGLDYITAQIYSYVAGDVAVRISLYND